MKRSLAALSTLLALAGALHAAGCSSFPSEETADASSSEGGADGGTGDGMPIVETGGGQEGSADTGGDRTSPLPDGSPDSGCTPESAPSGSTGVFVAQGGGPAGMCGAITAPCGTITAALAAIAQSGGTKNTVYVEKGTPYVEQVTLPAGVTIQGGWTYTGGGAWARTCPFDASQTVIQAPAAADRVVIVSYTSGSSTLDTLTISNPTTAGTGVSLYGVFASNAQAIGGSLVLDNVAIRVAAGGPGGTGGQGVDGGPPPASCNAGSLVQPGTPGAAGPGASAGTYDVNGYHPSTGAAGLPGNPGGNGTAAPDCTQAGGPQSVQAWLVVSNDYTSASNCCVQGGVCQACTSTATQICAGIGTPGCGTSGSAGGAGGTGGGASVGVFVWNETVKLDGTSSVTTSAGGQGGTGGPGGPVYPGSQGAPGTQSSQLVSSGCTQTSVGGNPVCLEQYKALDGGGPGGQGYTGGIGGQGGGGAGGDSICIVYHQGSAVTTTASCMHGGGGAAGSGGSPVAAAGRSLPTFTAP